MQTLTLTDTSLIKSALNHTCTEHIKTFPLTLVEDDIKTLYRTMWHRHMTIEILAQEERRVSHSTESVNKLLALCTEDTNKVILPAAARAWIEIDSNYRLNFVHKDEQVPELNYGLVLKYYKPIIRVSNYISKLSYTDERDCMPSTWLEKANTWAIEVTSEKLGLDVDTVEKVTSTLTM